MKRTGRLFERLHARDNLRLALHRALRGKRDRPDAREFSAASEQRLSVIGKRLLDESWRPGGFHQFVIHDPKERVITAPCFADRVVHHAIMNVCEPVFDRWLVADTFACRRGRGRLAALARARFFARRFAFFLKLDVRKYFDSVRHDRLLELLARIFKDAPLGRLFGVIVGGFRGDLGQGLPIGSLTSQHFANFYLGWLDRFVKERLRVPGYVRYMDDMVLWGRSAGELVRHAAAVEEFLAEELLLELKSKTVVDRVARGIEMLGCRVGPKAIGLNRRSRARYRRQLRCWETRFLAGGISELELQRRVTALTAFTRAGGVASWRFRSGVLKTSLVDGHEARTG